MKKIILLLILLCLSAGARAQSYSFRVLANQGSSKVKKSTGQEVALKTGATLTQTDVLIVSDGSYIGLMHNTGKTIEVRKKGTYSVISLTKSMVGGNKTISERYTKFISDRMNEKEDGSYKTRMNATGAVSRALENGNIKLYVPDKVNVINDYRAILKWDEYKPDSEYIVTVLDIFDNVIHEVHTFNTTMSIALGGNSTNIFLVQVEVVGEPTINSGKRVLQLVDPEASLMNEYNELTETVDENSAIGKLIFALFFEENDLYLDAITQYEDLLTIEPDVKDYQELYRGFLIRSGYLTE